MMFILATTQARVTANAGWVDYLIIGIYFAVTLGIGFMLRRRMVTSKDFFLAGRSLPSWVTGLAFVGANLGALEIPGMGAAARSLQSDESRQLKDKRHPIQHSGRSNR